MNNLDDWKRRAIEELTFTSKLSMASLPTVTARQSLLNPSIGAQSLLHASLPPAQQPPQPSAPAPRSNRATRGRKFRGFEENVSMHDVNRLVELTRPLYRQPSRLSGSRQEPLPPPLPPAPLNPSLLSNALARTIAPQPNPPVARPPSSPRTLNGSVLSSGANQKRPKLYRGATGIQYPHETSVLIDPDSSSRIAPNFEHFVAEFTPPQTEGPGLKLTGRTMASQVPRQHLQRSHTAVGAPTGRSGHFGAKAQCRTTATTVPRTSPNDADSADLAVLIKSSSLNEALFPPGALPSANVSPTAADRRSTSAVAERPGVAESEMHASQVSWMACGGVNYKVTTLPSSGERESLHRLLDCSSVASQPSGFLQHDSAPFYVLQMYVPQRGLTKIFAPKSLNSFQIMKILLGKPTGLEEQLNRYFESECVREGIRSQTPASQAALRGPKGSVPLGRLVPTGAGGFAVSTRGHVRSDPQPPPSLLHPHLPRSSLPSRDPLAHFQRACEDQFRPHRPPAIPRPSQRQESPQEPNAPAEGAAGPNDQTPSARVQSPALTLHSETTVPSRTKDMEQH